MNFNISYRSAPRIVECKGKVLAYLSDGHRVDFRETKIDNYTGSKPKVVNRRLLRPIITAAIKSSEDESNIGITFWRATRVSRKGANWEEVYAFSFNAYDDEKTIIDSLKKHIPEAIKLARSRDFVAGAMTTICNGYEHIDHAWFYDTLEWYRDRVRELDDLLLLIEPYDLNFNTCYKFIIKTDYQNIIKKITPDISNELANTSICPNKNRNYSDIVVLYPDFLLLYIIESAICDLIRSGIEVIVHPFSICKEISEIDLFNKAMLLDSVHIYHAPVQLNIK